MAGIAREDLDFYSSLQPILQFDDVFDPSYFKPAHESWYYRTVRSAGTTMFPTTFKGGL